MTREACLRGDRVGRARAVVHGRCGVLGGGRDASDMDFFCRVVESVIDAGATTINPDTVVLHAG